MAKRIALVTGGMGGIGQAICRAFHDQGIHTFSAYSRKEQDALAWQDNQKQAGYDFDIVYGDVTNFESCEQMVNTVKEKAGSIDILVNNAGITCDHACNKMTKEEWDIVISTDLSSIFYVTHALINDMKNKQFGRIINISSINGQKGQYGQVNYSAAKAGMHGFTKALALEVAKYNITVNTVSPGYVNTDMIMAVPDEIRQKILGQIPMGRFAEPEDVAMLVAFLAADKTTYLTGANIPINGGQYML